jgi:hypothetical protein
VAVPGTALAGVAADGGGVTNVVGSGSVGSDSGGSDSGGSDSAGSADSPDDAGPATRRGRRAALRS